MPKSSRIAFDVLLRVTFFALLVACEVSFDAAGGPREHSIEEPPSIATEEPSEAPSLPDPTPFPPLRTSMPYRGVNLAGAEFGDVLPGVEGTDYRFPTRDEVDYYLSKGMNTFRIGFKWERIQPTSFGELDSSYAAKLEDLIGYATSRGANVVLNPHNFARYYGQIIGSADVPVPVFADLWRRLALVHEANARVLFNLVNEPNTMPTEQWVRGANAAIDAIREVGAMNTVIVPGNGWTGAYSWADDYYGTPNAKAMLGVVDPDDRMLFEVHQYLDESAGGVSPECVSRTVGRERLAPFVAWLREHGKKGFIGEFAGGNNETCRAAIADMLGSMRGASDVLVGWLWWAAGPAWNDGYPFSLDPIDGSDRPQMSLLAPHLFRTSPRL
jgi:endoglucanase